MFGSKFHPLRIMSGAAGHDIYNGGGGGKGGDTPDAPSAPDYIGLAREQAKMQRDINRETLAANRVNQITPYGNMMYTQTGKDKYGNPTYTATQTLSPSQRKIYDLQSGLFGDLLGSANAGLRNYQESLENPQIDLSQLPELQSSIDTSNLPSYGINPGETYSDAIMRRLQPQIERETNQLETKLINRGIAPGTEAWNTAKQQQAQEQNDKLTSAVVGGMQTGLAAQGQQFGQNAQQAALSNAARGLGFQEALTNQNLPLNTLNALRTGVQMTQPNYVNSAGMQSWNAPDLMNAANQQYNTQMGGYNAGLQAQSNFMGGLMGLGGTLYKGGAFSGLGGLFGGGGGIPGVGISLGGMDPFGAVTSLGF